MLQRLKGISRDRPPLALAFGVLLLESPCLNFHLGLYAWVDPNVWKTPTSGFRN